jgi:phage repressor protein C with HTH and peptisase S24 domain
MASSPQTSSDDAFVSRLRTLVGRAGSAKALATTAGLSASGFHKYLAGAEPTRKVLIAIAQAAGVQLEWLLTGKGTMEAEPRESWPENHLTLLPLYGAEGDAAAADQPEKLVQLAFCKEWLAKHGFKPEHLATIRVRGDSMAPTFRSGDTLVVDRQQTRVVDGQIYVIQDQQQLFIKRLQRGLGGRVTLLSDNDRYPTLEADVDALSIAGTVVWHGALLCSS